MTKAQLRDALGKHDIHTTARMNLAELQDLYDQHIGEQPTPTTAPTPVGQASYRANWGANERPRQCPRCASTASMIKRTRHHRNPDRTSRLRRCECSQTYSTIEIHPTA